jgi:hypothetical protein
MGNGVHLSQKRKVRSRSQKTQEKNITVTAARYISDFSVAITFSSGITQLVNFLPLFDKYAKGDNLKYFAPERFRKFIVKNGNIYWGKNEDLIFPVNLLYKRISILTDTSEEILYII